MGQQVLSRPSPYQSCAIANLKYAMTSHNTILKIVDVRHQLETLDVEHMHVLWLRCSWNITWRQVKDTRLKDLHLHYNPSKEHQACTSVGVVSFGLDRGAVSFLELSGLEHHWDW